MKARIDKNGNHIGSGDFHVDYSVEDFSEYKQISAKVSLSDTTESVYVKYYNSDNNESITVRFSLHGNNAVEFGDQLNGDSACQIEILFHLGIASRQFIPSTYLFISTRQVAKKVLNQYHEARLTIQELYELGEGADISEHKGKIAKGSNYLIESDVVLLCEKQIINKFGTKTKLGRFIYTLNQES